MGMREYAPQQAGKDRERKWAVNDTMIGQLTKMRNEIGKP
jgi:hypothetical protein